MTERSCLILVNGELGRAAEVKAAAKRARGILCCDGAARHAAALKLEPEFVVGDMDSIQRPLPRWKRTIYWCDFDADRSDFEKALELALDMGCERAYVAGALGGRLDHAMINLAVAERFHGAIDVILVGQGRAELLGPGRHVLAVPRGATFSLLAAPAAIVTVKGAKYPLKKAALARGSRGLSNVATAKLALTVHEGRVWLFQPPRRG